MIHCSDSSMGEEREKALQFLPSSVVIGLGSEPVNQKPTVSGVSISGTAAVGKTLNAVYTFSDAVSYTHLDVYKRQSLWKSVGKNIWRYTGILASEAANLI